MSKLPRANKDLGQHFLRDQKVIDSICSDFEKEAGAILEVGPGPGILTKFLAQKELPFHVIEKDERFPEYLQEFISEDQITLTDALEVDFDEHVKNLDLPFGKVWMVSNLPYNVGTPLFVKFLQSPSLKYMTLMFQKEVADKVVCFERKKSRSMGSLMALAQNYFEVELLCKVPPGAFSPPPRVDSAVISLVRRENPVIPLEKFLKYEKFLRQMFQLRRKQVQKVMKSFYPIEKLDAAFIEIGVNRTDRAEVFTLEQVQNLFLTLEKA